MIINQLSIFIENKSGRLAEITQILEKNRINIRALSIAETADYGILRLIVDNPDAAFKLLKEDDLTITLTEVIAIAVNDSPGGLSAAIKPLADANIAVEYMYAFIGRQKDKACVILRVEENEKAIEILQAAGIKMMENGGNI